MVRKEGGKYDDFMNFGLHETCCNFVKNLYNFANEIDLDPFGKKLIEREKN